MKVLPTYHFIIVYNHQLDVFGLRQDGALSTPHLQGERKDDAQTPIVTKTFTRQRRTTYEQQTKPSLMQQKLTTTAVL